MREILTASLPQNTMKDFKKRAKLRKLTLSAFILHLFELEKEFISEEELLEKSRQAKVDYEKGKTRVIQSLSDIAT